MARSAWQEEYERKRLEHERRTVVPAGPAQDEQEPVPVLDDEPGATVAARAPLKFIEGDELMAAKFPDQRWLVEQILPEGLALVYADPKLGKSWLAYALARAVESGGVFLDRYQATEAPVIYLDLEQTEARSQARYRKMLQPHETLSRRLRFYHEFPRLDADALGELGKACEDTGAGLVIVDVLQSIWPSAAARGAGGNAYHQEAAVMSQLRKFAQEYRLAMLLLHHNNNAGTASGTKAILSVPDVLWKMRRPDEDNPRRCELGVTGRAVADMKFQLEWWRPTWSWRIEAFDGVEEDRFQTRGQTEVAW